MSRASAARLMLPCSLLDQFGQIEDLLAVGRLEEATRSLRRLEIEGTLTVVEAAEARRLHGSFYFARAELSDAARESEAAFAGAVEAGGDCIAAKAAVLTARALVGMEHRWDDVEPWIERAAAYVERCGDPRLRAEIPSLRAALASARGLELDAEVHYRTAIELSNEVGDPADAKVLALALTVQRRDPHTARTDLVSAAADLARRKGSDHPHRARVLLGLAVTQLSLGEDEQAERSVREAIAIYDRVSPNHRHARAAQSVLSIVLTQRGSFAEAFDAHERACSGDYGIVARFECASTSAELLQAAGRMSEAEDELRSAMITAESELGVGSELAVRFAASLAEVLVKRGAFEEPDTVLQRSEDTARSGGVTGALAQLHLVRGMLEGGRGRDGPATAALAEAARLAENVEPELHREAVELLQALDADP